LVADDKADATTLGVVLADHLERLEAAPVAGSPEHRLQQAVEERLNALRFSRESHPEETTEVVALLRRFLVATPK